MEDEELQAKVKLQENRISQVKKEEEQKDAASKLEDKFYDSLLFQKPVGAASAEPKKGPAPGKNASGVKEKVGGSGAGSQKQKPIRKY
jgi:hypothetical protein